MDRYNDKAVMLNIMEKWTKVTTHNTIIEAKEITRNNKMKEQDNVWVSYSNNSDKEN